MQPSPTHYLDWEHITSTGAKVDVRLYLRMEPDTTPELLNVYLLHGDTELAVRDEMFDDVERSFRDNLDLDFPFAEEAIPIR